jgi:hypothetical protein
MSYERLGLGVNVECTNIKALLFRGFFPLLRMVLFQQNEGFTACTKNMRNKVKTKTEFLCNNRCVFFLFQKNLVETN